jgi:DNA-binding winged helix-turn-helix (wHTH) protein
MPTQNITLAIGSKGSSWSPVRPLRPVPPILPAGAPILRIDRSDERAWLGETRITLPPKAFALLRHLAERRGRLVTKEELLEGVWPGVFVGDAVLKVAIREIRAALGDDARDPRFIQTAHRRGYRLIGKVELIDTPRTADRRSTALAAATSQAPPSPMTSRLAGRQTPLAVLDERLALAIRGERQLVFVTGEPGIGKTALVEAFLERTCQQPGVIVARGQCLELTGTAEAYLPFLDAFGRLLRDPSHQALLSAMRRYAPTWLRQMPSLLDPAEREAIEAAVRGATSERMLREMAEAMEALAADRPIVLVLEDLQWSDASTVDLLSALANRRERARVLVIGTYRPADVVLGQHPLKAVTQDLFVHRRCSELALELLTQEDVSAFVANRLAPHRLPRAFASLLYERTEGNPLFMVSVLDYLTDRGHVRAEDDGTWVLAGALDEIAIGVPDSLRQMIEKQIERLAPDDRQLLEAASVAGMEFPSAAVAGALGVDDIAVEERAEALVRRGSFIVSRGLGELPGRVVERFAFAHAAHQHVFYERVPPARRARLHQRIGERGEQIYGGRCGEIAYELAVHFEQARDLARSVTYLRMAAENAARRFANQEALGCLKKALELVGQIESPDQIDLRLGLIERVGVVLRSMGAVTVAAEQFLELARLAAAAGRIDQEARAWLYAASVLSWFNGERCLRAAERAERLGETISDPVLRAHVRGYAAYARLIWQRWDARDADACANAMAATESAGALGLFGFHVGRFVHVQAMRSDYAAAAATADRGLALTHNTIDSYDYLMCQFWRGWALLHAGRWGEMQALLNAAERMTEQNGHRRLALLFRLERAWLHEQAHDFERAATLCEESLAEARESSYAFGQLIALVLLGFSRLGLGQHQRARAAFDEIGARLDRERLLMDWIWKMPLACGRARLELASGTLEAAARYATDLLKGASASGERTWLALAHTLLAEVAIQECRWKGADASIRAARTALGTEPAPLAAWRVEAAAARLYAHRGQHDLARGAGEAAAAELDHLADSLEGDEALREAFVGAPEIARILTAARADLPIAAGGR